MLQNDFHGKYLGKICSQKISLQDLLKKSPGRIYFRKKSLGNVYFKKSAGKICQKKTLQAGQAAQFVDHFRGYPTSKVASHISLSGLSE